MNKVTYLSHRLHDATRWTVEQMLADALEEVQEQRRTPTKAIVLFLDDANDHYDAGFLQAGFTMSQMLAFLEIAKQKCLAEMGY